MRDLWKDGRSARNNPHAPWIGNRVVFATPLLPIEREEKPPDCVVKPLPRFYGRLLDRSVLDLNGMSGGPVFGITRGEDGVRYKLVAIQSSWDEDRTIAACEARSFIEEIGKKTREHFGGGGSRDDV